MKKNITINLFGQLYHIDEDAYELLKSYEDNMRRYFSLGHENRLLSEHVARLEEQLAQYQEAATSERLESYLQEIGESKYRFATACVVANTVNRAQNLITLNRGRNDNVIPEMGVLSPDGAMVGYVVDCSDRYAVAMSVLNTSFRASGRLAGSEYYGSIYWDGRDQSVVILGDVSKYADPQPGTAYTVRVRLAAELSRLSEVILVANRDLYEIRDLQQSDQIEQHTRLE